MSAPPPTQIRAAALAGRLVAQGLVHEGEILPPILDAALAAAPAQSPVGLRTALLAILRDARAAAASARPAAARRVRQALAPLVAARAGRAALLRAAAAADPDGLLLAHEQRAIAEHLVRAALGRRTSRGRA